MSAAEKYSEQEITRRMNDLPDPGPARISTTVMSRIRAKETGRFSFKLQEVGLGFAGSLAGLMLGLWLAGVVPDGSQAAVSDDYLSELTVFDDEIDRLAWEMSIDNEEEQ